MKSKTKRLAEQAGFVLWEDEEWKPQGAVVDWSCIYDVELEKFAELIVRECISEMCEQLWDYGIDESNNPSFYKAIENVKLHFGVE